MLRAKKTGMARTAMRALNGIVVAGTLLAGAMTATAQTKLGAAAPVTYDNRYEVYGGLSLQNFQAGQTLPKRMNLGGGEAMGTYWLTNKLGVAGDYRIEAGTTPVLPNAFVNNRPLVYLNEFMGGVQYRGPKNHYAAIDYHALAGAGHGNFTHSLQDAPVPPAVVNQATGLYTNRTSFMAAVGGSVDFNASKNWAVRVQPDLIFEHFGTELREFFSLSGGVVYRFGKR